MAKIGNEARLVLKLARERAERVKDDIERGLRRENLPERETWRLAGRREGLRIYEEILVGIEEELQAS